MSWVNTYMQNGSGITGPFCSQLPPDPGPGPGHLPFRLPIEESTGRVDVDHLLVNQCPVAFLRVFLGSIPEESTADGLLYSDCGLATGDHIQLVSSRGTEQERTQM